MLEFTNVLETIKIYTDNQQKYNVGGGKNSWFSEIKLPEKMAASNPALLEKFKQSKDCSTSMAVKEMLDFCSIMQRSMDIRNKTRYDFMCGNAIRNFGTSGILGFKKTILSDMVKNG